MNMITRLAGLKRNTSIIEPGAPPDAGGFCAAVINGRVEFATWDSCNETIIILSASEAFALRHFLNSLVDATMNGGPMPEAVMRGRP